MSFSGTLRLSGCLPLVIALSFPASAAAQTASPPRVDQEVVVTATVAPQSIDAVGQPVTLLTREDLEQLGLASVVEAIRLAPGVDVRARGPRDVQSDFSIRGATFGQSLILLDGLRLNDRQSAHHNGDIPVPMSAIDRIEIVNGAGSTANGADALGGTINILTRRDPHATAMFAGGQHGYAAAEGSATGLGLPAGWTGTAWASRSGGFAFDRDFAMGGAALRGRVARGWDVDVRHQRKAFGANGFYGPSPSKEWTDQTLASTAWQRARGAWAADLRGSFRNHGDHFRWDIARPGFSENQHRTNSAEVDVALRRDLGQGRRVSAGAGAGADWVRSTNLGDRDDRHQDAYAELQLPLAARAALVTGLRLDTYTTYGSAWSPSVSVAAHLTTALRARASVRRAFRIPTFTELYYHDPANLGSPDLRAEHGWSADAGLDWSAGGWMLSGSPFVRWDHDVIDWVRATPTDLWRSTNVRDVTTTGLEIAATRRWRQALVRGSFSAQKVDAPVLAVLSKYVFDYARSAALSTSMPLGAGWRTAVNVDWRDRVDGQRYALVGVRLSRQIQRADLYLDATNLLDADYHEVGGVEMPGRWITAGLSLR